VIEAEALLGKAEKSGGDTIVVKPGAPYSGGEVVLFTAREKGASIRFRVDAGDGGRRRISARFARASDMGSWRLLVDGTPLGSAIDLYNGEGGLWATHVVPTGEVIFGEVVLAPGDHVLELECAGKGERSSAHFLAVDGFMLAPVE